MRFVAPAELHELEAAALEELLERSELLLVAGEGEIAGIAAAALLFADYAVLRDTASLRIDTAEAWAGAAWRLGRGALRLRLEDRTSLAAADAYAHGLCDEVIAVEAAEWLSGWMRGRSELALDSAAALIRLRGGDRLERAEFARLFAIGEPQRGMTAFLLRKRSRDSVGEAPQR